MSVQKRRVSLYWLGYQRTAIHGCDPTTARHGDFCLLGFPPGPMRPSLDNLGVQDSSRTTISMPDLVRTPDRHARPRVVGPYLKPSTDSSLQVAGLQEHATTPSEITEIIYLYILYLIETGFVYRIGFAFDCYLRFDVYKVKK